MDVRTALNKFSKKRIAIVGDVMLDHYIYGKIERVSEEAPVEILKGERETYELGGAGNVAANIASLGGNVSLFGYFGKDYAGKVLLKKIKEKNINHNIFPALEITTQKIRFIGNNQQQVFRYDKEICSGASEGLEEKITRRIKEEEPDLIIFSDYDKGCLSRSLCSQIKKCSIGIKIVVDPRPKNKENYHGAYLITPNMKEAKQMFNTDSDNIEQIGIGLQRYFNSNILVTKGKDGMSLFGRDGFVELPTQAKEVYDVIGAGDTVVAVLGLGLASGLDLRDSAILANYAAGIVVGRAGTATVSRSELEGVVELEHRKLKTFDELKKIREDLKRKGKKVVFTSGCYDILHPGHTKLLEIAKSFGDILILAINGDKSPFFKTKGNERPILTENDRIAVLSALKSVDFIAVFEDDSPLRLIKELKPDIKVKGGSYIPERVAEEDLFIKGYGGESRYVNMVGNYSTTQIINKIKKGGQVNNLG